MFKTRKKTIFIKQLFINSNCSSITIQGDRLQLNILHHHTKTHFLWPELVVTAEAQALVPQASAIVSPGVLGVVTAEAPVVVSS